MNGLIFGDGRFGYKPLPKVACTSLKIKLYELNNGEPYSEKKYGKDIHTYSNQFMTDIDNCDRRFIVVRDPIRRLLSAYGNRVCHHYELSEWFIAENYPQFYDKLEVFDPGLGQFLDGFNDYVKVRPIKHHVRPISDFLKNQGLTYFTDVIKLECINQLEAEWSSLLKENVVLGREQTGGRKIPLNDLSSSQMDFLLDYYRKDYELLKGLYSIDSIWREWRGEKSPKTTLNERKEAFKLKSKKTKIISNSNVKHVSLWKAEFDKHTKSTKVHGLFLAEGESRLFLVVGNEKVNIRHGLPSSNFAKKSSLPGSDSARFVSEPYPITEGFELWAEIEGIETKVIEVK